MAAVRILIILFTFLTSLSVILHVLKPLSHIENLRMPKNVKGMSKNVKGISKMSNDIKR